MIPRRTLHRAELYHHGLWTKDGNALNLGTWNSATPEDMSAHFEKMRGRTDEIEILDPSLQ